MTGPSHILWQDNWPSIVWDGLGLSALHSGVGIHGQKLYASLGDKGCLPRVTMTTGAVVSYVEESRRVYIDRGSRLMRITKLKPVFSNKSYLSVGQDLGPVIYHGLSNFNLPQFVRRRRNDKFVLTLHDLIPLLTRDTSALALQMRYLLPIALKRADRVICISNWTKDTLLNHFGAGFENKVVVIGNAFDAPRTRLATASVDFLTVARGESYKRLDLVAEIAKSLGTKAFHLVTDEAGARMINDRPANLKVHTSISHGELQNLYGSAKCLIHPSKYEGWCLPASEALMAGAMVLFQSGSGIDEVCSLFRNKTLGMSADATLSAWVDAAKALLARAEAIGNDEVCIETSLPSWGDVALRTLNIYQSLIQ